MLLLAIALQVLLIAAELFILRAFVSPEWSQEWLLQLFWSKGGAAALCTAISAHLIALVLPKRGLNARRCVKLPMSARSASSASELAEHSSGALFMRVCACIVGCTLLLFSLLTIVSASIESHRGERTALAPLLEAEIVARDVEAMRCASLPEARSVAEINAVLADQTKMAPRDIKTARRELARARAAEAAHNECLAARAARRAAEQQLVASLPAQGVLLRQIPGVGLYVASATYPIAQGIVAWLMLWAGSVVVHMIARPAQRTEEGVRQPPTVLRGTPAHDALLVWIQHIEAGDDDVGLAEMRSVYASWCDRMGVSPVSDRTVNDFYKEKCKELGIPWTRSGGRWAHRGVKLPK